jgi:hypothetical protein
MKNHKSSTETVEITNVILCDEDNIPVGRGFIVKFDNRFPLLIAEPFFSDNPPLGWYQIKYGESFLGVAPVRELTN